MTTETPNWVYGTKSSFAAGELTPTIEGRADLPLYQSGAKKIINWMILPSGGLTRRPGTEFIWAKTRTLETRVSEIRVSQPVDASSSSASVSDDESLDVLEGIASSVPALSLSVPSVLVSGAPVPASQDATSRLYRATKKARTPDKDSFDKSVKQKPLAPVKEKIGPRSIPDWTLHDVEDNGNCFYDAVVHQMERIQHNFLETVPEMTLPRDSLRLHIQGEKFKDREWAEDRTFDEFVKKIDVILAIIDTRSPENGYVYYYLGDDGDVVTHVHDNDIPLPVKQHIRLAATGDHFLSVVSESLNQMPAGGHAHGNGAFFDYGILEKEDAAYKAGDKEKDKEEAKKET